ncbi:hypothetical protein ACLOJK_008329 [Asimina triloba]
MRLRLPWHTQQEKGKAVASSSKTAYGGRHLSQIRRIITLEDPYQGSTAEQERAYNDLERIQCNDIKDVFRYMNDYKYLAAKSGRMFISSELSEKFFRKLPQLYGKEIAAAFEQRHPRVTIATKGVKAIPGKEYSSQKLNGERWDLKCPQAASTSQVPGEVTIWENDNSISMRFHDYRKRETPAVNVNENDVEDPDEEAESEIMLMAYDEESIWRDLRDLSPALSPISSPSRKIRIWDGLGQPSGKFDYQVRYDMPKAFNETLLEDIKPTGWEDENDEDLPWYLEIHSNEQQRESDCISCTTNYQSCIDELSESEDDEQEKEMLEMVIDPFEDIKPFDYIKNSKNIALKATTKETEISDMEYPKLVSLVKDMNAYNTAKMATEEGEGSGTTSAYNPPKDYTMGPPNYPPAVLGAKTVYSVPEIQANLQRFKPREAAYSGM